MLPNAVCTMSIYCVHIIEHGRWPAALSQWFHLWYVASEATMHWTAFGTQQNSAIYWCPRWIWTTRNSREEIKRTYEFNVFSWGENTRWIITRANSIEKVMNTNLRHHNHRKFQLVLATWCATFSQNYFLYSRNTFISNFTETLTRSVYFWPLANWIQR